MAYKEIKLEPGEARGLYDLWNAGMAEPKKPGKAAKKPTAKKTASKKPKGKNT